jgi:hypothetical protein
MSNPANVKLFFPPDEAPVNRPAVARDLSGSTVRLREKNYELEVDFPASNHRIPPPHVITGRISRRIRLGQPSLPEWSACRRKVIFATWSAFTL